MPKVKKERKVVRSKEKHFKNKEEKRKGFTLIELLVAIAIFSIVAAIGIGVYMNVIRTSKDTSSVLAINNLKEAAYLFGRENAGDKYWNIYEDENGKTRFICMTIQELVNTGYFDSKFYKKDIYNGQVNDNTIVKITQNEDYSDLNVEILNNSSWDKCEASVIPTYLQFEKNVKVYSDRIIFTLPVFEGNEYQSLTNYKKLATESIFNDCDGTTCSFLKLKNNTKFSYNILRKLVEQNVEEEDEESLGDESSSEENSTDGDISEGNNSEDNGSVDENNEEEKEKVIELQKTFDDTTLDIVKPEVGANKIDDVNTIYNISINFSNKNIYELKGKHYFKSTVSGTADRRVSLCNTSTDPTYTTSCSGETTSITANKWYLLKNTDGINEIEVNIKTGSLTSYNNVEQYVFTRTVDSSNNFTPNDYSYIPEVSLMNCHIKYDMKGGENNPNNPQRYTAGSTVSIAAPLARTGNKFSGWSSEAWTGQATNKKIKLDTCYPANNPLVITANWAVNKVTIKYNVNGGTITAKTNGTYNWKVDRSGYIMLNNAAYSSVFNYDATGINLPDYNNKNYINITRSEMIGYFGKEWIKDDGSKTYNHSSNYNASDFCDASNGDCTVNLKVNWTPNPSYCGISFTGVAGKNGYYTSNALAKLDKRESGGIKAVSYGLASNTTTPTGKNDTLSVNNTPTNGTTVYGYVKFDNGVEIRCNKAVKVDTTAPSCTGPYGNGTWTNKNVTVSWGCSDSGSGCDSSASGGKKVFSTNTTTTNIGAYTIKDKAGNSRTCPAKNGVGVYIDKTAPDCSGPNSFSSWTSSNRTISWGCKDSWGSGCDPKASGGSKKFTSTTKTATIEAYTVKDKAGNSKKCSKKTVGVYVDKTDPVVKWVGSKGASSEWIDYGAKNIYMHFSDAHSGFTGSSYNTKKDQKYWYAYSYVKKKNGSVCCNSGWKKVTGGDLCSSSCNNSKGAKYWRAYKVYDKVGNVSQVLCTYYHGSSLTKKGPASSCTVNGVAFKS